MPDPISDNPKKDVNWEHHVEEITELSEDFATELKKGSKANYNLLKQIIYALGIWQRHMLGRELKADTLDLIEDLRTNAKELEATYKGWGRYVFVVTGVCLETVGAAGGFLPLVPFTGVAGTIAQTLGNSSTAFTHLGGGIEKLQGPFDQGKAADRVMREYMRDKLTTRRQDWNQQANQDIQAAEAIKRSAQDEETSRNRAFLA